MNPLLSPLTMLLLACAVFALAWWKNHRALRLAACIFGLLALFAMTPLFANAVLGAIERQAEPAAGECDRVEAVVLLAGGADRAPHSADDFAALTPETLSRLFAFAQHPGWRELPLVIAGGGPYTVAEASVMAALLHRLDASRAEPVLETTSRTTWENAQAVRRVLPAPRRIVLASSALHLPRARRAFLAAGFEVCRWPLHSRQHSVSGISAWWPQSSALRKTEAALHEFVGDFYYQWRLVRGELSNSVQVDNSRSPIASHP